MEEHGLAYNKDLKVTPKEERNLDRKKIKQTQKMKKLMHLKCT